jgi:hypothetical protein
MVLVQRLLGFCCSSLAFYLNRMALNVDVRRLWRLGTDDHLSPY